MTDMKMYILDLGRMHMDKSLLIGGITLATVDEPNKPAIWEKFPVTAFLFDHPEGKILFDAGCHLNAMGPEGHWSEHQQKHFPYSGTEEDNLLNKLKEIGVSPEEITHVVISHMHNDHAGCIASFPNAQFYVHEDEFAAAMEAYSTKNYNCSFVIKDIDTWINKKIDWRFVRRDQDNLPIAKGITLMNLGSGHSYGMLGIHAMLKNTGSVILVSDAIYRTENFYPEFKPTGIMHDSVGAKRTVQRIYWMFKEYGSLVCFGHDLNQLETLKTSPDYYYD